ncbi:M23 family metallopeptidase [Microbacterium halophytorum]|uniref:M23 family metallopeptidase n=1 Tax=Microbacterium halophytorum TaxID=2067568 RepID=UPI001E4BCF30|nr:M23 family metallopeptidase [Microbacterium halophytorum]
MAHNDSSAGAPEAAEQSTPENGPVVISRRDMRRAEREFRADARRSEKKRHQARPVRSVATVGAVLALIAGVAIPAYAASSADSQPTADAPSAQDIAEQNAQSLAVGDDVKVGELSVAKYSATTPDEIAKEKAAEAAEKRAKEAAAAEKAAAATAASTSESSASTSVATSSIEPIDGVANPLPRGSYRIERTVSSGHEGADLSASSGTPIYAVKPGKVVTSTESLGGWGVTVAIDHLDGTTTLYGHMTYGSRAVQVGQTVTAGQQIGQVGNTGHSFGSHLHIELRINGAITDPVPYLGL